MNGSRRWLALPLVLLLGACGADETEETEIVIEEPATMAPAAEAPAGGMGGMGVTAQMAEAGGSGAGGEVTVTDRGAETEVMVRLTGTEGGGTHPGHIHAGTCAAPGEVVQPLTEITTDATGTGTMTTTVAVAPASVMDGQHVVQYHQAGGGPGIACAAIPQHGM